MAHFKSICRVSMYILFLCLLSGYSWAQNLMNITLIRTSENSESTTGELFVDGTFITHTLELPWRNNQSYVSAIPTGEYAANLRYDKSDSWRLQLKEVPNRSGVQLHIGNYPQQIEGCILVGFAVVNSENRLQQSSEAYSAIKHAFYGSSDPMATPNKEVRVTVKYHPQRTELKASAGAKWVYSGSGVWLYSEQHIRQMEYRRDPDYIYVKYNGPNMYMKFPLHGGGYLKFASRPDGPWTDSESTITRRF